MNDRPLISVIVPMYNCGKYISKCIKSLCTQTYDALEIIIVDDGSEDNGEDICREYARQDRRICYISQENSGAFAARNAGLNRAVGEWIAFCDSDDYMERDMLEYLYSLAVKHNADITQCGIITEYGSMGGVTCCPKSDIVIDRFINADKKALKLFGNSNWCKLFRRRAIEDIRFESFVIGEDLLFNIKAALAAEKIVLGSRAKYHYVQRSGSLCNSDPTPSALKSMRNVLNRTEEILNAGKAAEYYHNEQLRNDFNICSLYVRFCPKGVDELIEEVRGELRGELPTVLLCRDFSVKEKIKALLISYMWGIYSRIIRGKPVVGVSETERKF